MRRNCTILGVLAAALLASTPLAVAQRSEAPEAARPVPGPSRGMPSDLDTTGMAGTQPGCVAPPGGTSSATGGDLRTPATAGDVRTSGSDPDVGTSQTADPAEPVPRSSTIGKAGGC